jgi:hypothetical protein
VGPMQVFSAANRLAGKSVYAVEVATNTKDLKVAGEGGLLSFLAHRRFSELEGPFDSVLLVCGVATRNTRAPVLFAWLRKMVPAVRRMGSVCADRASQRTGLPSTCALCAYGDFGKGCGVCSECDRGVLREEDAGLAAYG